MMLVTDSSTDQSTDDEQGVNDLTESDKQIEPVQYDSPTLVDITKSSLLTSLTLLSDQISVLFLIQGYLNL